MQPTLDDLALDWVLGSANVASRLDSGLYCATRDFFQARLDRMTNDMLRSNILTEDTVYIVTALAGEIGNNSFDHNLGQWPDVPGIFFAYTYTAKVKKVVLADRGQGVYATLKKVKPQLNDDIQALETAFKEKISGRAPENRGNGLKFVRQSVQDQKLHLTFLSGDAKATLNNDLQVVMNTKHINGCLAVLDL